jgi:hypothetical protein
VVGVRNIFLGFKNAPRGSSFLSPADKNSKRDKERTVIFYYTCEARQERYFKSVLRNERHAGMNNTTLQGRKIAAGDITRRQGRV